MIDNLGICSRCTDCPSFFLDDDTMNDLLGGWAAVRLPQDMMCWVLSGTNCTSLESAESARRMRWRSR